MSSWVFRDEWRPVVHEVLELILSE